MSRQLRLEFAGAILHVTSRGIERRDIFKDDVDRRTFLDMFGEVAHRFRWTVYQYTLMSNHYHALVRLNEDETLSRGMHWLNSGYARRFNRRHDRVGHLLQGRFHSPLVQEELYLLEVIRYVALNPVRAGIVAAPEHYRWSSHAAIAGMAPVPDWLAADQTLSCFAPKPKLARTLYTDFVDAGVGLDRNPWTHLVAQIYLGDEAWVEAMRQRVEEKPRSDDHPRRQTNPARPVSMSNIVAVVADVFRTPEEAIRHGRGGRPRSLAAWIASREARLDLRSIAAGLRLRSSGHVSDLVRGCDDDLRSSPALRTAAERCVSALHAA